MKKTIFVFGVISGSIISVFMGISMALLSGSMGEKNGGYGDMVVSFSALVVAFSFIFVGIKNYRDKQSKGVISFGKAFLLGFMISVIASTLFVITWGIQFHFFMPNFIDKYSAMQVKELHESGVAGTKLEEAIRDIENTNYSYKHNPVFFAIYTYMEILPLGIIITLISALILKKKIMAEGISLNKNTKELTMKKYITWLKTAAIFQFIFSAIHTSTLFVAFEPTGETEKQLITLMETYKFDLGAGFHRTMGELVLIFSACVTLVCLLAGLLNWYLIRKNVEPEIMKGVILINLIVFGIFFGLTLSFAFLQPIVLVGLIVLFLILSLIKVRQNS